MSFINELVLSDISWQGFERLIARLLLASKYSDVRIVGQSSDGGADLLASRHGRRWLFQAKRWSSRVGVAVLDKTVDALRLYKADVPVIVSLNGFEARALEQQRRLLSLGVPLQLWDRQNLLAAARRIQDEPELGRLPRDYQEEAVRAIVEAVSGGQRRSALICLATGLGKTFVAGEAFRRLGEHSAIRALVVAHTNDLVYQLERAFWPFLRSSQDTSVWNGLEKPSTERLREAALVFSCLPTISANSVDEELLSSFDLVIIDECHHVGSEQYERLLNLTRAGSEGGAFLLGLTATPWRADGFDLSKVFGDPLIAVDMVTGLKRGFLANVDYRIYTDNIDWNRLALLRSGALTPRRVNRTLFIDQWDDAVVDALAQAWSEVPNPRAIIFCGTIDHAIIMKERLMARRFCAAAALYSTGPNGRAMSAIERNRTLADFHDGNLNALCVVDIFNEGIDVPDVNILVFQRVTHSRRIFVQQLGRGLRLSPGKDRVVVLDFVSDIRRFAAGISLKDSLAENSAVGERVRIRLPGTVSFRRLGGADHGTESFLREWLNDVAAIEEAGEDVSALRFPPAGDSGR